MPNRFDVDRSYRAQMSLAAEDNDLSSIQERVDLMRVRLVELWPHPLCIDSYVYLVSEIGELGDALLRLYRPSDKRSHPTPSASRKVLLDAIAKEIADVEIMLCTVASHLDIDIETEVFRTCEEKELKYGRTEDGDG